MMNDRRNRKLVTNQVRRVERKERNRSALYHHRMLAEGKVIDNNEIEKMT